MKFGVNTFIWADQFGSAQIPLLELIKKAGFDGLEIPLFQPQQLRNAEVQRALADSGLQCTICSVLPPDLSTVSSDAAVREKSLRHLQECVQVTTEMGAKLICGPLYSPVGYLTGQRRTKEEWKYAVDTFQRLGPTLQEFGVTLALEPLNRYETFFLNTAADAAALCDQIAHPQVGILFDTYHANIEEKDIPAAIRQAGRHIRHVHSCENDRGTPGTGHVRWPAVFQALHEIGYNDWLTIESFGFSLGALSAAASIWRDLAPTPQEIAFEGVKFLQRAAAGQ